MLNLSISEYVSSLNYKHLKNMDKKKEKSLPGVEVNIATDDKVTPKMVREETRELNNNPRNNEIDE